jgi:putative Holliday junction resolvase
MKSLGLDVGDSKVGVAVSDSLGYTAQGIMTFKRRSLTKDLRFLERLIIEHDIGEVIVGLPLKMNGTRSSQTNKILSFCDYLSRHLKVPVRTWDERLTTVQAIKVLKRGHIRRKKRGPLIDKVAAVIILQGYLDHKNLERELEEMPYADSP